jgi:dTDP-4-dehydrorhamnose reductase
MANIIIFGSAGLLGASLVPYLRSRGHFVLAQSRSNKPGFIKINMENEDQIVRVFLDNKIDVAINLIAATNVDECEINPKLAYCGNVKPTQILINAIKKTKIYTPFLIHISTDQVYSGKGPHKESVVIPVNVYGLTKYAGELIAAQVPSSIIRTNFYGASKSPFKKSFSDWVVEELKKGKSFTLFDDVFFSALNMQSLVKIISEVIQKKPIGVFNIGCKTSMSKAAFGLELAKALNLSINNICIGSRNDLPFKAKRPHDMTLSIDKIEGALNIKCPFIDNELQLTAQEYKNV